MFCVCSAWMFEYFTRKQIDLSAKYLSFFFKILLALPKKRLRWPAFFYACQQHKSCPLVQSINQFVFLQLFQLGPHTHGTAHLSVKCFYLK